MPSTGVISGPKVTSAALRPRNRDRIHCDRVVGLDAATESLWNSLRQTNPSLQSGYFHPEFFRAVSRVRNDLEIAISNEGDQYTLLPFQRVSKHVADPMGGMMNDFHGPLAKAGAKIDYRLLLAAAGVKRFDFHALVHDEAALVPSSAMRVFEERPCPYVDLSNGQFEYQDWLKKHSSTVKRQGQKTRALVRRFGPLRFEMDCRDPEVLEKLIEWKRERYQRTRIFDILSVDWTANLLREVLATRSSATENTERFEGRMSVLWAGDEMVAAHFGFVCGATLHYWFPAYSHVHRQFSPGTQLMKSVIDECPADGVDRIDLGYGSSTLKDRFANNSCMVLAGCLSKSAWTRMRAAKRFQTRELVKRIPMKETLKRIIRPLHPNLGRQNFR